MSRLSPTLLSAAFTAALLLWLHAPSDARPFVPDRKCENEALSSIGLQPGDSLLVQGTCTVGAGTYKLGNVNIANGTLLFEDAVIHFWASAILIENGGRLVAGSPDAPIGTHGGSLTIHLYGADPRKNGEGAPCLLPRCGVPEAFWNSNLDPATHKAVPPAQARRIADVIAANPGLTYPGQDTDPAVLQDYFYAYHPLHGDDADPDAYFGYKVLGVSYGGTLQLFGKNGACAAGDTVCDAPASSGTSWVRLGATARQGSTTLTLDRPVFWRDGDQIVITTTDYLPGHSEVRTVRGDVNGGHTVTLDRPLDYDHIGVRFPLTSVPEGILDSDLRKNGAEIRAAVALLSRSIAIVSEGKALDQPLDCAVGQNGCVASDLYFGGHTIIRQGFQAVQIQGVEFYQLGQGGRIGHYPIHFHLARRVPNGTFVKDSSIHDSMTRWIVLHATQNVTLARNVGYKSIGHGFYLEDGTETDNRLLSNIGILARAAVDNVQNERKVPGILVAPDLVDSAVEHVPYRSDADHPTVFWIMNGWNDFQYNVAVGATACGVCYWLLPGWNSGMSRELKWERYASLQSNRDRAGSTPLKSFVGNACSAAMMAFNTVGDTAVCHGVGNPGDGSPFLRPLASPSAPASPFKSGATDKDREVAADYYPNVVAGGSRFATRCDVEDCSATGASAPKICASDLSGATGNASSEANCMVTVLDRFTSSFTWADFNFAAIWLRPQWYLVTDSVITDVQNGGLNFVTGGGYSASDRVNGHWALVRRSVFIGSSQQFLGQRTGTDQPVSPFALDGGPFNPYSKLYCAARNSNGIAITPGNYCLAHDEGVSFPTSNFGMSQRLFSVYDGPAFQESNAYLDIRTRVIDDCKPFVDAPNMAGRCDANPQWRDQQGLLRTGSAWLAGQVTGLLKGRDATDPNREVCYMPNAAIGWKQPNGFYYPPAFHSHKLFFDNVDIRHFVIEPLFKPGTFVTDVDTNPSNPVSENYCVYNRALFDGFTDVDRQTVLNDDDGSLTGYQNTVVVNLDPFFAAPSQGIECRSAETSHVSPYQHVTTVVYPQCAANGTCAKSLPDVGPNPHTGLWDQACSNQFCFGVPLYRQLLVPEDGGQAPAIRMMGQSIGQRSTLTANHGVYYLDTTVSEEDQKTAAGCAVDNRCNISVFRPGEVYYVFLLYAGPETQQTYQIYVGKNATFDEEMDVWATRADIRPVPISFTQPNPAAWPDGWERKYDSDTGILTVKVDMASFAEAFANARKSNCRPFTMCEWDEKQQQCLDSSSKSASICHWAVDYLDCAEGGCIGFGFRLPHEFSTLPSTASNPRPAPMPFPHDTDWDVCFQPADPATAGSCHLSPVQQPASCTTPPPANPLRQPGRGDPVRITR